MSVECLFSVFPAEERRIFNGGRCLLAMTPAEKGKEMQR